MLDEIRDITLLPRIGVYSVTFYFYSLLAGFIAYLGTYLPVVNMTQNSWIKNSTDTN